MRTLLLITALFAPSLALAGGEGPWAATMHANNALSAVALNASAATRTVTGTFQQNSTNVSPYTKWRVSVFYTWAAATTVTAVFSCSEDGTNFASLTSRAIVAGASTVSIVTDTYTTGGASADIMLEYDISGCRAAKVVFGGASAGASDLITVDWVATVGG